MDADQREQLEAQLSAYLDGELSADEKRQVDAFLSEDADGRRLLAELRATVDAVRALPRARSSDDLMDAVRARLERRALIGDQVAAAQRIPARSFPGKWLAAAAVIALTFTAAYMMWPPSQWTSTAHHTQLARNDTTPSAAAPRTAPEVTRVGDTELAAADRNEMPTHAASPSLVDVRAARKAESLTLKEEGKKYSEPAGPLDSEIVKAGKRDTTTAGESQTATGSLMAAAKPVDKLKPDQPPGAIIALAKLAPAKTAAKLTVIELAYKDETRQQQAVATLQSRFAFQQARAQVASKVEPVEPLPTPTILNDSNRAPLAATPPAPPSKADADAAPVEDRLGASQKAGFAATGQKQLAYGRMASQPAVGADVQNVQPAEIASATPELELSVPDEPALEGVIQDLRVHLPDAEITVVPEGDESLSHAAATQPEIAAERLGQASTDAVAQAPSLTTRPATGAPEQKTAAVVTQSSMQPRAYLGQSARMRELPASPQVSEALARANQPVALTPAPTSQNVEKDFTRTDVKKIRLYMRVEPPASRPASAPAAATSPS